MLNLDVSYKRKKGPCSSTYVMLNSIKRVFTTNWCDVQIKYSNDTLCLIPGFGLD